MVKGGWKKQEKSKSFNQKQKQKKRKTVKEVVSLLFPFLVSLFFCEKRKTPLFYKPTCSSGCCGLFTFNATCGENKRGQCVGSVASEGCSAL